MSYSVIERGRHKCDKPAAPSWNGLHRGAVIECTQCGQRYELLFTFLTFPFWRRLYAPIPWNVP
jgi:hypothetical protein